jgi:hypothetical protein
MNVKFCFFAFFLWGLQGVEVSIKQVPRMGYPEGYLSKGYPPERRSHSAFVSTDSMLYLHGGYPLDHQELWSYNVTTRHWTSFDSSFFSNFK